MAISDCGFIAASYEPVPANTKANAVDAVATTADDTPNDAITGSPCSLALRENIIASGNTNTSISINTVAQIL